MAKKNEAKKVSSDVVSLEACLSNATESLKNAREAVKLITDYPKNIIDRLTTMKIMIEKSSVNILKRVTNLEAKADRDKATVIRKTAQLDRMKAQATKLASRIAIAVAEKK